MDTLRASGSEGQVERTSIKYKEPKRWSSFVSPAAVPTTEFAGGQNYIKRWRLPPPLDAASQKPVSAPTQVIEAPVEEESDPAEEEQEEDEEMDDLAFLRSALNGPSRDKRSDK